MVKHNALIALGLFATSVLVGCGDKETVGDAPSVSNANTANASDPAFAAKKSARDATRPRDGGGAPAPGGLATD
jgi:hypothetical protein